MVSDAYRAQVQLLVRTLPFVAEESCFALKGGTAINLFVRELPRLSVDIDLVYLPLDGRAEALSGIEDALLRIAARIRAGVSATRITERRTRTENALTGLLVASAGVQIKIEVTPVLRGTVYPPELRRVTQKVEDAFGFAEMQVVSFADLYAGKCVAAFDRQHPRDLFDVRDLLRQEGIDDNLRTAFAVYLISHGRPMAEVLSVRPKPLRQEFEQGFAGMTDDDVTLADLEQARSELKDVLVGAMPQDHRRLLVSVEQGAPEWDLLGVAGAPQLPAVRWRLQNISSLDDARRAANVAELARMLGTA